MKTYRATVELFLAAENEATVYDAVSGLLTENGVYSGDDILLDWAYSMEPVEIPNHETTIDPEKYFSEGPDGRGLYQYIDSPRGLYQYIDSPHASKKKSKSVLELVTKAFKMMNAGSYHSSYEGQIIDKLRDAMKLLNEDTTFSVDMTVYRSDLLALCDPASSYRPILLCGDDPEEGVSNKTMLARLLQYVLYDDQDGPQLRGDFNVNDEK